jgi:tetratricopeptide (TPR) repeat protein
LGNQLKSLVLLYVRPVKAMSQILDQGRLSVALVLAVAAGLLFAVPAYLRNIEAQSQNLDALNPVEVPPTLGLSPILLSLGLLAVVFVPVAVIVASKLEGTGSAGVALPRDYMPMLVCHIMAYVAVLLPAAVLRWIPGLSEFDLVQIGLAIAAQLGFAFLSLCAIRTVAGTGWGRAVATAVIALAVSAGALYVYSFVRGALYFLASPFVLYYLYIMFGQEFRGFGGGLSSRQRMRQLLEFAAVNPHDADAPYQLGLIYQQRRDYTRARECFEKAIAIDPKEAEAQYQLGRTLRTTGDPTAALEHLRAAAAIDNKLAQSEVLREIGAACLELGRNEEARDILREYTTRRSFDPEGLYWFGEVLSRVGDVAAARGALQQAIEAARTAPPQRRRQVGQWGSKASKLLRQLS